MAPKDELLVIIEITSTIIRAGKGVHELIQAPLIECVTRTGRRASATLPYRAEDYIVGTPLVQAEAAGEEVLEIIYPLVMGRSGMEIADWTGLEALLRYIFEFGLLLPRPPSTHPTVVCVPPQLSSSVMDHFYQLFFEQLLVPSLLISTRPLLAAFSAGVTNCVVLDVGYRGEGSEVSVVHDCQVVQAANLRIPIDEGHLDDWLALQLLQEDPTLPEILSSTPLSCHQLVYGLRRIIQSLKEAGAIAFDSTLFASSLATAALDAGAADDGALDIAKQLETKVKKDAKGKGKKTEAELDAMAFEVPHPFDAEAEPVKIGGARHRYLEPLYMPSLLAQLAPSASSTAQVLNFVEYEGREILFAGVQEAIGVTVDRVISLDTRKTVLEAIVVVSSGKVAGIKALGNSILPLLSPLTIDPESGSDSQAKSLKYARVPDYFANFKVRGGELGCYLGGCILAKLALSDAQAKLFTSKSEYSAKGPAAYRLLDSL